MKKLFISLFLILLCLCCLVSCDDYKENEWFSEDLLNESLVPDLPKLEKSFIGNGVDMCVSFSDAQFESYAKEVYDYLCSQDFEYFGTRGSIKSSLAGMFSTYYFKAAEVIEDFLVNGDYVFVYSDGTPDEYGEPTFYILAIRYYGKTTVELSRKKTFTYTTKISLRQGSEYEFGGRIVLSDEYRPKNTYLSDYESWLSTLAIHSVAEIRTTKESIGVKPGSPKDVISTTDKKAIADMIDGYARVTMIPITREEAEIDGGTAYTVEFILTDGTVKKLSFNNGNYVTYEDSTPYYFKLDSLPTLDPEN